MTDAATFKVLQQYKRQTQDPKGPNSKGNKVRSSGFLANGLEK